MIYYLFGGGDVSRSKTQIPSLWGTRLTVAFTMLFKLSCSCSRTPGCPLTSLYSPAEKKRESPKTLLKSRLTALVPSLLKEKIGRSVSPKTRPSTISTILDPNSFSPLNVELFRLNVYATCVDSPTHPAIRKGVVVVFPIVFGFIQFQFKSQTPGLNI